MGALVGSRYQGIPTVTVRAFGRTTTLPDVSQLPLLGGSVDGYFAAPPVPQGTQWDAIAAQNMDESDWWRVAFPNYERARDLLWIPLSATVYLPPRQVVSEARGGDLTPAG